MIKLNRYNSSRKSFVVIAVCTALITTLFISGPGFSQQYEKQQGLPNFNHLIKQNVAAVVSIRSTRKALPTSQRFSTPNLPENIPEPFRRFFEDSPFGERNFERQPRGHAQAQGSGFIISSDGYILTNAHVVADTDEVFVGLNDRRELAAEVIGMDKRSDVALLKVAADDLPAASVGDSGQLEMGDWVLAIGSPFGFDYSASQGIVSALGRSLPDGTYVPFIQTDVAVNPGNSGGPLFDLEGNVIGINSQIYSRSGGYMGLSFAIPINLAMNVVEQLKTDGHVSRGWLGVMIQDMTQTLAESFTLAKPQGALVSQVTKNSPADKAGFVAGDIIMEFNGATIDRSGDLPPLVGTTRIGSEVDVLILRDGKEKTLAITIGQLEQGKAAQQLSQADEDDSKQKLGVVVRELDEQNRQQLNLDYGLLIGEVQQDSPAAKAGLRKGDVILSFNRQKIDSAEKLSKQIADAPTDKPSVIRIQREQGVLFVPVQIG